MAPKQHVCCRSLHQAKLPIAEMRFLLPLVQQVHIQALSDIAFKKGLSDLKEVKE